MALESTAGKTPSQALQIEAKKAMEQAKRRTEAAEQALRKSKNTAERLEAQKYVRDAGIELKAAQEKYGWVFDWQKANTAAATAVKDVESAAATAVKGAEGAIAAAVKGVGGTVAQAAGAVQAGLDATARDAQGAVHSAQSTLSSDTAAVKKHIVKKGESLSLIAKQYTGSVKKWKELYEANKATVGNNPDLIQPGMELTLPW